MKPDSFFPALPDRNCPCSHKLNRRRILHDLSRWGSEGGRDEGAWSACERERLGKVENKVLKHTWTCSEMGGVHFFLPLPQGPKMHWHGTTEKPLIPVTEGRERDFLVWTPVEGKTDGIRGNSWLESYPAGARILGTRKERSAPLPSRIPGHLLSPDVF